MQPKTQYKNLDYIIGLFVWLLLACTDTTSHKPLPVEQNAKSLKGIYKIYTTSNSLRCESIIHYFDIDADDRDSAFLYHAFCHPNNNDPKGVKSNLTPQNIMGEWSFGADSLIRLKADNGMVVKLKVLPDGKIETYKDNGERLYTDLYFDSSRIYR